MTNLTANAPGVARAGGKAESLARVAAIGLPVPDFTVIDTTVFDRFLAAGDLRAQIETRIGPSVAAIDTADPSGIRRAAADAQAMVMAAPLPVDVRDDIARACASVGSKAGVRAGDLLAVRSSAVGEDGATASFAGQLDTVLGVPAHDHAALEHATRVCWASRWSDRALAYQAGRSVALSSVAVLVQRQVDAVVSGVLFSAEPVMVGQADTGAPAMLLEFGAGLGDALVSGRIDPGRLRIDRETLAVTTLQALPDEAARLEVERALTPAVLRELATAAQRLEEAFRGPQDVEWAVDRSGRLWILQSRPITTARPKTLWSNANVNENFPDPISPLLYSIASSGYTHYFQNLGRAFGVSRQRLEAMRRPLDGIIGVHGGRMYYNLTNIHAVLRMAPGGRLLTRAFNQFVGAQAEAESPDGAASWSDPRGRVAEAAELGRIAAFTGWQYAWLGRRVRAFERQADAFAARTHPDRLATRSLPALVDDLAAFMDIRCHRWKNASLADAAAMVSYAMLQRSLKAAGADANVHTRLLCALPGVPSAAPALRLWDLSRAIRADERLRSLFASAQPAEILESLAHDTTCDAFAQDFRRYLDDWGFRSTSELMLTTPSLQESPEPAIALLKHYALTGGEAPADAIARQASERIRETRRLLRRLVWHAPHRAVNVWRWLTWTQRAVAYRERARLKQALLYQRCRRIALAIGDRLVSRGMLARRDDVFCLTWPEINELGSGRAMFPYGVRELVAARRAQHDALAAMKPPDDFHLATGDYLAAEGSSTAAAAPASADGRALDVAAGPDHSALSGTSACGGRVTARAAVLEDVTQADRLTRGDILVTRQTDPGWGPILGLVSGLVIERGGMLSHGAIIAREFGLPCVVGVAGATARIPHGAVVTVDGDRGTCAVGDDGRAS